MNSRTQVGIGILGFSNIEYVSGKAMKLIGFLNCNLNTFSKELKELS